MDDISLKNLISLNVWIETKKKLLSDDILKIPLAVINNCWVAKDINLLYSKDIDVLYSIPDFNP